jgi:hypothetical protein
MTSRGNWDRETGSLLKRIDIPDLTDQLDGVDVGVGLLIGYLIRRGTD